MKTDRINFIIQVQFLLAFCCAIQLPANAQTGKKEVPGVSLTGCPSGIYADLAEPLSYNTGYEVDRKEPGGAYRMIGRFVTCGNSAVLYKRMTGYAHILPGYGLPAVALADALWKQYHSANKQQLFNAPFPLLQLALGDCYLDTTVRPGQTYQYRFRFTDSIPVIESAAVVFRFAHPRFAAIQIQRVLPEKKTSLLEWRTASLNAAPFFEVYRQQPGTSVGFRQIPATRGIRSGTNADSLIFMVIDSTVVPGITYDYFIVTKDYLGNSGNHSDTVRLRSGGRQNVSSVFNLRSRSDSNGIRLSWNRIIDNGSLQNILVLRSARYDTGYAPLILLPVADTVYTDKTALGGQRYFYQLIVQGALNFSQPTPRVSGMFTGQVNLLPPYGLQTSAVTKGVRLRWQYANPQNISGFKVYRALSPRHKMQLISDLIPATEDSLFFQFTDTTAPGYKSLFYYAVAAISRNSKPGPLSNIASSTPGAWTRVPAPAGLRYLRLNDSVISITWNDLQRETPGIASYRVFKSPSGKDSLSIKQPAGETRTNEFIDTLHEGEIRWYSIKTINSAAISSIASPPIRVLMPVYRPLPPGRVQAFRQGKNIILGWDGSENAGILEYHIYKAENTGKIRLVDSLSANHKPYRYTDGSIARGNIYFYFITSVTGNRMESRPSEEVRILTN